MTSTDLTGMRFGALVALYEIEPGPHERTMWECECECGKRCTALGSKLLRGEKTSCGCGANRARERSQHNQSIEGTKALLTQSRSNNASGHRGVSFNKQFGKWEANITHRGKRRHLGRYEELQDAIDARLEAEQQIFAEMETAKKASVKEKKGTRSKTK